MKKGYYHFITGISILIITLISLTHAKPVGYVVKLAGQWQLGAVSVHELSTGKEYLIDNGKCYGPVFSPDGRKVAYAKGDIYIKNSDGTGEATAQGINVPTGPGGDTEPCMSWIKLSDGEYIYWSQAGTEVYRTKLDSKVKETVYTDTKAKRLICVSVSADGKRGACTIPRYSAYQFDMETKVAKGYGGCQGSISPSGKYVTHNTSGSHKNTAIHDFDSHETVQNIPTPTGSINWQRFSHHTDDYFCATVDRKTAYICEWKTKTYTQAGSGAPLDYYPKEVPGFGSLDKQVTSIEVKKPVFQKDLLHFPGQNMIIVNSSKPYQISITNLSGRVLYKYANNKPYTVKLSNISLTEGIHVVRLETENRVIVKTVSYFKAK